MLYMDEQAESKKCRLKMLHCLASSLAISNVEAYWTSLRKWLTFLDVMMDILKQLDGQLVVVLCPEQNADHYPHRQDWLGGVTAGLRQDLGQGQGWACH